MEHTIVELKHIFKRYHENEVLKDVSISFNASSIHSIVGENGAGKSTLTKILCGVIPKTKGSIIFDNKRVEFKSVRDAHNLGIRMVYQELFLMPDLTIAQNIYINREFKKGIFIGDKMMNQKCQELFDEYQISLQPDTLVKELNVAQMQMVEILKNISQNVKLLVLDEPTTALSIKEINDLFKMLYKLKDKGVCIIYISHKMDEILEISDKIFILRDGNLIDTVDKNETSREVIIKKMIGRDVTWIKKEHSEVDETSPIALNVKHIDSDHIHNVSFILRKGEILGFAGWENNLTIGKTGNHAGFASGAQKVLPTLIQYLAKYNAPKVFVNGYSRTAAIANIITTYLFDNELVDEANYYAYLFETPKGVSASNEKEYNSVFNIVNSADLVTYVAPSEYGLKRIGKDIELYSDKADEIIQAFNPDLQLGQFTPKEQNPDYPEDLYYLNDVDFVKYFLSGLLEPVPEAPEGQVSRDLSTREHYVDNIQSEISYFIGLYLSLPDEIITELKNKISELSPLAMLGLLDTDGLYNFITPTLDAHEFVYNPEVLKPACNAVAQLAMQKIGVVGVFLSEDTKGNLMRLIYFHTLEAVLPLLLAL